MKHTYLRNVSGLWLLISASNVQASEVDQIRLAEATVLPSFTKSAGISGAGLLCLPKGVLQIGDFVESNRDFQRRLEIAIERRNGAVAFVPTAGLGSELTVRLVELESKLCAKSWGVFGLGNTKALSGKVRLVFAWTMHSGSPPISTDTEVIELHIGKKNAATPAALFDQALEVLVERVRDQHTK
ncbi:MAG: hypothetical protein ACREBO_02475 [Novosphingobium sp.]